MRRNPSRKGNPKESMRPRLLWDHHFDGRTIAAVVRIVVLISVAQSMELVMNIVLARLSPGSQLSHRRCDPISQLAQEGQGQDQDSRASLRCEAIVSYLRLYLGGLRRHHLPLAVSLDPRVGEAIRAANVLSLVRTLQGTGSSGHRGVAVDAGFQVARL
jgi:hypothetical protein